VTAAHQGIKYGRPVFSWGSKDLIPLGEARNEYFSALRNADKGDFAPLLPVLGLALRVESFLRTGLVQSGYEGYVASEPPGCNGNRLNLKLTNG